MQCATVFIVSVIRFDCVYTESKELSYVQKYKDKGQKKSITPWKIIQEAQRRKVEAMYRILFFRFLLFYQQFIVNLSCVCLEIRS